VSKAVTTKLQQPTSGRQAELERQSHNLSIALRFARAGVPVHQSRDKRSIYPMFQRLDAEISGVEREQAFKAFGKRNEGRRPLHVGCTTNEAVIEELSRQNPHFEWSVSTGPAGWFVIDADADRGGDDNVRELFDQHGGIPADCFVVRTQSGGMHIVFKNDRGLGGRAGQLGALGCDIRANGGQIVCPGTLMSSGKMYTVDPKFASFESAFKGKRGLPAVPAFIADLIGASSPGAAASLSDSSPVVGSLIEKLEQEEWPSFDDAFDPVLNHDLNDVAAARSEFGDLYDNPSDDHSRNRFRMAQHLVLSLRGLTVLDYACFCLNWDGAGVFSDEAGRGRFTIRDLAREFARALDRLQQVGIPSDGSAFGAITEEDDCEPVARVPLNVNMNDPGAMVNKVEDVLIARDAQVYRRDASLVEVVTDKPLPGLNAKLPTAQFLQVNVERMSQLSGSIIDFRKFNARAGANLSCPPPKDLMVHIMARGLRSKLPRISLLSAAPLIRPDGSVLCEPGYDPSTEVYLAGTFDLPPIAESPTREEGREALMTVAALFSECAFADKATGYPSTSVSLSAVLSVIVAAIGRLLVPGIPMLTITAATPGSGKSFIGCIIGILLTGRDVPVSNVAAGVAAELDKRLSAGLLGGAPVIHLDNVNGKLDSDLLCQILTERSVAVRPLGVSEEVIISGMPIVFANGNGVRVDENLGRRTLLVELDAGMEKPELRSFNLRPDRLLLEDRGKYLAAVLTALRAFILARQRGEASVAKPKLGSFEEWSDYGRSLLIWYGFHDPLEAMATAQADDPEKGARSAVFISLRALFDDKPFTVNDVIERIEKAANDVLEERPAEIELCDGLKTNLLALLPHQNGRSLTAQALGMLFRAWATKVEMGLTFRRLDRNAANVTVYTVTPARAL
jgi:Bifunctional DNA primase/polymerase, N-terminal